MSTEKISQPSTFGNPRRVWDVRFHRIARKWLLSFMRIQYWFLIGSLVLNCGLLVYAGLFVEHSDPYLSDGTMFSCRMKDLPVKKANP